MKSFLARKHQIPSLPTRILPLRTSAAPTTFIRSITKVKPEKYVNHFNHRMVKLHQQNLKQKEIQHELKGQRYLKVINRLENPLPVQPDPFANSVKQAILESSANIGLVDAEKEDPDTEEEKAHKKTSLAAKIIDADPKKALEYFNESLAVDPELVPALLGRATIYESNEDIDRAYADYKKLSEILHKKFDDPIFPYKYRFEDSVLYEVDTRLIMMDFEKGNIEKANSKLFTMLEHAPDEDLYHLAISINGDISRLFHDDGNKSDYYYRDIVRKVPVVIRWTDQGRGLFTTRAVSAGETIWIEKPLVFVPHNVKKGFAACHFCGKLENDVEVHEPNISTVPPHIMEMFQQPMKLANSENIPGEELEKWYNIADQEQKFPKKDPQFLSEFDFRLRLRENNSNFEMFAESVRQTAAVDPFHLLRDAHGRTFCSKYCKDAAHDTLSSIDNHPSFTRMEKLAQKYNSYSGLLMARIFATYQYQAKNHITPTIMDHLLRMTHPMTPSEVILSDGEQEEFKILLEIFPDEQTRKYLTPRMYFQLKSIVNWNSFDLPSQVMQISVPKEFGGENSNVNIMYDHKLSNTTLLTVASYLQHSCDPNVVPRPILNGTKEVGLMAVQDLQPGELLTWSYIDETLPVAERRKILNEKFFINCKCDKCYAQLVAESPTTTILREKNQRDNKLLEEEIRASIRKQMEERRRKNRDKVVDTQHPGPFLPAPEEVATQKQTVIQEDSAQEGVVQEAVPQKDGIESVFDEGEHVPFEERAIVGYTEEAVVIQTREPEMDASKIEQTEEQASMEQQEEPTDNLQQENEDLKKEIEKLRLLQENEKLKKELEQLRAQLGVAEPPKQAQPTKTTSQVQSTTTAEQPSKPPPKNRILTNKETNPFAEEGGFMLEEKPSWSVASAAEEHIASNSNMTYHPPTFDDKSLLEGEDSKPSEVPLWENFEPPLPQPAKGKPTLQIQATESVFGEEEMIQAQPYEVGSSLTEDPTDPLDLLEKMDISPNVLMLVRKKMEEEKIRRQESFNEGLEELLEGGGEVDPKKNLL